VASRHLAGPQVFQDSAAIGFGDGFEWAHRCYMPLKKYNCQDIDPDPSRSGMANHPRVLDTFVNGSLP
jgi:hypothetical protein